MNIDIRELEHLTPTHDMLVIIYGTSEYLVFSVMELLVSCHPKFDRFMSPDLHESTHQSE